MRAAVLALKQRQPARIIIAVPVAASETCEEFGTLADEFICVMRPELLYGVGFWYEHFAQTTDEEVRNLLKQAAHEQPRTPAAQIPGQGSGKRKPKLPRNR